jgi:serine/threonine protein kinase
MDEANQIIAGRYRILRQLAEGGFGSVWLAQSLHFDRRVVIKIMGHGMDEGAANFFLQESRVLASIDNPHVGGILDYGELEDGRPYLALEYVEGVSLEQLLGRGPLPVESALVVAEAVADALSAAHTIGVIHRDLKPSNIIVPEDGRGLRFDMTKLIDFGIRGAIRPSTGTTQAGEFYGTPRYMSPEQLRAVEQSPATDVYGLGLVLYEMIYGTTPFRGDDFFEILTKTLREEVSFPASPFVSDSVLDLIRRCLSKQAKDRPQNGSAMLAEIRRVRAALPRAPTSPPDSFRSPFSPHQQPEMSEPNVAPSPHVMAPRPHSSLALIALLIGAAMVVGIAPFAFFFGWNGGGVLLVLRRLVWVFVGLILSITGVGMWFWVRKWLGARKSEIQRDADSILLGRKSLDALTQSLAIQVDAIITRVKQVDEMIIAHTLAMMVKEYEGAMESKDRQSALVNAISILEKLTTKLSPWYVRHDKFVAFVVSSVGVVSGLVTIVTSVIKIKKGTP